MDQPRLLLTYAQAANAVALSESSIKRAIRRKELRKVKVGRSARVRLRDLEEWALGKIVGDGRFPSTDAGNSTGIQLTEKTKVTR